jgi:predicted P-loop ATPase
VSIKDVRNFLESDYIKNYNPIDEYLFQCYDKWDGKDHIRALARTVPTNNPYWADWFYTWFLGMVDQWRGFTHRQYGNSVAPLLISKQGYNKSTFCRRLLPPELQWGYNDNLILSEKRQVYQAMAQFMVINLDEFNQISPQVQQGFLKNLIQLPTLKYKPPYGSHVMEFPRLASFIATSNITDILTDPSGNRRFIGVELTGPIDVSVRPNYQQLFAQALTALHNGEKSYFDAEQVKLIMKNNCQFEVAEPIDQYFMLYFELVENEKEGEYLTAAEIFDYLKKQIGSSLKVNSLMGFGRKLANMSELKHKRFADGMKYLVKKK